MARPFFMTGGTSSSQSSQYLVSFKAGKMVQNGSLVSPIKDRKGLVYLQQSDDQLMHFCWKDRTTGQVEEDLIIFPDDAEFLKISQCKAPARAFVLKFKTSPRRLFFWAQENNADKDEEYINKINEYINNPPPARSGGGGGSGSGSGGLSLEEDVRSILGGDVSTEQLMQVLGSVRNPTALANLLTQYSSGGSGERNSGSGSRSSTTSTPAAPQTPTSTPAVTGTDNSSTEPGQLQARLQEAIASGASTTMMVDLSTSINMDLLQPLLTNPEFLDRLRETLPPTGASVENPVQIAQEASSTIRSPQFQQALSSFSVAMESGQLGPLIQQFGLGPSCVDAANLGSMELFVKALAEREKATVDISISGDSSSGTAPQDSKSGESKKTDKDDDEEEPMALD